MGTRRIIVALLAAALVLGACGGDEADTASEEPAPVSGDRGSDGADDGGASAAGTTGGTTGAGEAALDAASGTRATGRPAPQPQALQDQPQGVTFRDYGINPWVATAEDGLSTFAMDVDTASYTLARAWLNDGTLPRPEAVRPEEFVNRFDYGYPQPEGTWGIHVDGGEGPWNVDGAPSRLVRIGLQAQRAEQRPPTTLTFVIDTSGSMGMDARLELVKRSLVVLVDRLRPDDRIGIVEYGSDARTVLNPTPVAEPDTIRSAIARLQPGGSTFAEGGLFLGYRMARDAFDPGGLNTVVLASDGVANVGQTGPDAILARVRDEADEGITLLALGVGMGNFNDVLLERLANDGDGTYFYIDSDDEADRLFGERLISTLMPIAVEAKVQVEFDPAAVTGYRLIGYENRDVADEDFRNDEIDAGEIGAGHTVTAVYEVALAPDTAAEATALTARIRWADPDGGDVREQEQVATVGDISAAEADGFALAATAVGFAEVLRASEHVAGTTFEQVSAWGRQRLGGGDEDVVELVGLIDRAAELAG